MSTNIMNRMIAVFTALAVILCMMPCMAGNAYASETSEIPYPVENGNIYFNKDIGYITSSDETVTAADIPETIAGVKVIGISWHAFSPCNESIKKVTIPNTVTTIEYNSFMNCLKIEELNIPKSVTKLGTPFDSEYLKRINVDPANPKYSSVDGVLFNKDRTTLIEFPGGHGTSYDIPKGVKVIGDNAFYCAYGLKNVTIPDTVTYLDYGAFGVSGITSIVIPSSVKTIKTKALCNCRSLKSVTIQGADVIEDNLIWGSLRVKELIFSEGVKKIIGNIDLDDAPSLEKLILPASLTSIEGDLLDDINEKTKIYVKKGSYAEKYCKKKYPGHVFLDIPKPVLSGLKYASSTTSSATVKWNASKGATAYEVYKSGKKYKTVKGTSCAIKGLKAGSSYKIKVRPVVQAENVIGDFQKVTVPVKPGKVKLNKVISGKKCLTAKWSKKNGSGYQIAVSKNKKFSKAKKVKVTSSKILSKKVTKRTKGSRYYVKVRAYKTAGGKTVYGKWSDVKRTGKIK